MSRSGALEEAAAAFIDDLATAVAALANRPLDGVRPDVAIDASELAAAIIDSDGRLTDDELWAWIATFGPELPTSLSGATPAQVRTSNLVAGKHQLCHRPSALFELLVDADQRRGSRLSWVYYERAMALAHAVAALDLVPSPDELEAIDDLRTALLQHLDRAGLPRPGTAAPPTGPGPASGSGSGSGRAGGPPGGAGGSTEGPAPAAPGAAAATATAAAEPAPLPPARPLTELLAELDAMVGLDAVKKEVRQLAALAQIEKLRRAHGLPVADTSRHLVFAGNPGTGKTTVARLLAQIYRTLEVVPRGQLVEADRSLLVAGYVGQTATKTRAVVESALGGMLLVDEAYALVRGGENDFGREAIDTLVKLMEDHRADLVVVAAGYTDEMGRFLDANPGLRSRFAKTIVFPDYSDEELVAIFTSMGTKQRYVPDASAVERLRAVLAAVPHTKGFGNARLVRNLFEAAIVNQATRLVAVTDPTVDQLGSLTAADIPDAPAPGPV